MSETNKTQKNKAKYVNANIPTYNLIEYSHNYSKTCWILSQYYRNKPFLTDAGAIATFHAAYNSALFKFKQKITGVIGKNGTKKVEIMVLLKYLRNLWRTLESLWSIVKLTSF